MPLTANTLQKHQRPELSKPRNVMNVAAATTIYAGAFVAKDAAGNAVAAPATGAFVFMGIAFNNVTNTGAITTDFPLELSGVEILKHAVTGAAITNITEKVYYVLDDALSMTIVPATGVAGSQVGRLHGFHEDGTPLVDFSKNEY